MFSGSIFISITVLQTDFYERLTECHFTHFSKVTPSLCKSIHSEVFHLYMRFPENRPNYLNILYIKWDFSDGFSLGDPCCPQPPLYYPHCQKIICNQIFFIGGGGQRAFFQSIQLYTSQNFLYIHTPMNYKKLC